MRRLLFSAALALACSAPAEANDGIGSVSAGGIIVGKTDAVAMKKEVLTVSTDLIKVEYEFLNESAKDQNVYECRTCSRPFYITWQKDLPFKTVSDPGLAGKA